MEGGKRGGKEVGESEGKRWEKEGRERQVKITEFQKIPRDFTEYGLDGSKKKTEGIPCRRNRHDSRIKQENFPRIRMLN